MKTFQEIVNQVKKENPQMMQNLSSIVTTDGTPVFSGKTLGELRAQMEKIYNKINEKEKSGDV